MQISKQQKIIIVLETEEEIKMMRFAMIQMAYAVGSQSKERYTSCYDDTGFIGGEAITVDKQKTMDFTNQIKLSL